MLPEREALHSQTRVSAPALYLARPLIVFSNQKEKQAMFRQKSGQPHPVAAAPPARFALTIIITILLAIIATPLLTFAAPPGPTAAGSRSHDKGANSPQAPQASYPLNGDVTNPTGS